ncbi:Crp/Fnr family transcriptional regulator [Actinocrispum wychmicini]|uniref:CRP/FNR family transcriptional regulator n=1 Tax=Actinocrispum wychmicini TaxID=1213861 RepID=A0A4R2JT12_9PSEU|nr:Crp/Fnr family transcriptional regulator [Actinocrispum wychmicini]TCO62764.1 CRP/FNR family transcriptional regulator [Actinocrispum wychmicini]
MATSNGLRATPLLAGLSPEVVAEFLDLAADRAFARGEALFAEGDKGGGVFVLLSGKVKMTRPGPDGKDVVLNMAGPGDLLGELAVFDGGARQATATAVRDTAACWVSTRAMLGWLARHPSASFRMMCLLAERIRLVNDRLEDASAASDVATRVARALVEQGSRFGWRTPDGLRLTLDLSQDELAHHVRASRERVNQVLMEFARRGWIRRECDEFVVINAPALTQRARYRPETAARRPSVTAPPRSRVARG